MLMKYLQILMFGLLLALAGCGHSQALYDDPPRSALEEGRSAEQQRDYVSADAHYDRIDDLTVRYMTLNHLHSAWDNVNANIAYAQRIVREQPDFADGHVRLAEHYYQKGVLGARYSRESLGSYPRDFLRGEQEHYYNSALDHAERAMRLQPNMPEAYLVIGEVYLANEMHNKALVELKRAITYNPDFAGGYYAIGRVYVDQKKYELSERYFIKAIKLDSTFYDAYYFLGDVFLELGLYEYAAHTFLEILRHKPQDGPAFDRLVVSCRELAHYYIDEKRYAEAMRLTQAVLKVRSDYDVHQVFLQAKMRRKDEALVKEQQAVMTEMAEEEVHTDVSQFVDLAFADQSLEALLPSLDAKNDTQFAEALQHMANQAYQEAYTLLQTGGAQNRENPQRLLVLALSLKQLGRADEAIQTLNSLTSTPDIDSRTQLWAWLALRTLGQQVDPNTIYRVLGVVIQVHDAELNRIDSLIAYLDGRVRHISVDGRIIVWDRTEGDISDLARSVVYTAQAIARDFPSEQQRDALQDNAIRISLLTVGGVRVLEDTESRINNSIIFSVFDAGTKLLEQLLAIYNAA